MLAAECLITHIWFHYCHFPINTLLFPLPYTCTKPDIAKLVAKCILVWKPSSIFPITFYFSFPKRCYPQSQTKDASGHNWTFNQSEQRNVWHISGIHLGCLWKCLNIAPIGHPSVQSSYQTCPLLEINSDWSEQGQVCWRPVRTVVGPDAYPRPHKTRACRFFWFPGYGLPS